jgi:hypothetical protein
MQKVQLTLTPEEENILMLKASSLGYSTTKYIKFLIAKEAYSIIEQIPQFTLSKKTEQNIEKATKDHQEGKTIELKAVDDLDSL